MSALPQRADDAVLTVDCVAIRAERDGRIWTVPRPARHNAVISVMFRHGYELGLAGGVVDSTEGFLLCDGSFVDRFDAYRVAVAAQQLLPDAPRSGRLQSIDLW
jgi:hypothetical protein